MVVEFVVVAAATEERVMQLSGWCDAAGVREDALAVVLLLFHLRKRVARGRRRRRRRRRPIEKEGGVGTR